jgi:hypothetical protein
MMTSNICLLLTSKTKQEATQSFEKAGSEDDGSHTPRPHDDACIPFGAVYER